MFKKISKILFSIMFYGTTAIIIFCLGSTTIQRIRGEQPNVFGYTLYIIQTDSMTGELEVGDVILSKKKADYKVGSVVTYISPSGLLEGHPITHKVVKVYEENGVKMLQTQGVKPGAVLDTPIKESQIEGVMQRKVDIPVSAVKFLQKPFASFCCLLVPIALYACYEFYILIFKDEEIKE